MDRKEIIEIYNQELVEIYNQLDLQSLEDNDFSLREINVLTCPSNAGYLEERFHPTINLWDIINCNKDLKFFTGQLFLHQEFINRAC